jgi:hypothetical protein
VIGRVDAVRARVHVIMEFSTLSDHEGWPCQRCHLACSNPSGTSSLRFCPPGESSLLTTRSGCHRRRIADRTVFEHVVLALVHGSGYERISTPGCSDRTIRRRVKQWAELGISERVHALALEAYDRMIGFGLSEISVDGCITKAPSGGEKAGRSPVDRGKQGLKRSVASDACGVPSGSSPTGQTGMTRPLLGPTLDAAKEQVGAMPGKP